MAQEAEAMAGSAESIPSYPLDMGTVRLTPATTSSPVARTWADRAFAQAIGYNHEESYRLYALALEQDNRMAMAHWGMALCLIANYNNEVGLDEKGAQKHAVKAQQLVRDNADAYTAVERSLIDAAVVRCSGPEGPDARRQAKRAYAEALRTVYTGVGMHIKLVACVFAESLMVLNPSNLWDLITGKPTTPDTLEAESVLESLLNDDPDDVYASQLYVHLMERSPTPEKALRAAETLRTSVPGQGHLVHMASHIYAWTGQYNDAIKSNLHAVAADDRYVAMSEGNRLNFYTLYRLHHVSMLAWAAMFDGRYQIAMDAAQKLRREVNEETVNFKKGGTIPFGSIRLEAYRPMHWHVQIRFGKWNEIIDEPLPDSSLYPYELAVSHYAKGFAYAALGKVGQAKEERDAFDAASQNDSLKERRLQHNFVTSLLAVDSKVLDGEIAYREENFELAFSLLREAAAIDARNLNYDEPWPVPIPVRQILGALLAERGIFDEALLVFQSDLGLFPENAWSLRGLLDCARGLGKPANEIADIERHLKLAEARADIDIATACFCAETTRGAPV